MSTSLDRSSDRRSRRRRETIAEALDVAVALMRDEGVGGLNLAEVARRMGIRPPSLYQYFDSKLAVYDALFAAGNRQLAAAIEDATGTGDPLTMLRRSVGALVAWCADHPVLTQLMFWRPVPGFEPSPDSFAHSQALTDRLREVLRATVATGQLDPGAAGEEGIALYTSLVSGVVSQHLANEPGIAYDHSRFAQLAPIVVEMFIAHYTPRGNHVHNTRGGPAAH